MEGRRDEGERESVQGLRRCRHPGHVSFVPWGKGRCSLGLGYPEYVAGKLWIEPRRLFHHLAVRILEHHQAHKLGHGKS